MTTLSPFDPRACIPAPPDDGAADLNRLAEELVRARQLAHAEGDRADGLVKACREQSQRAELAEAKGLRQASDLERLEADLERAERAWIWWRRVAVAGAAFAAGASVAGFWRAVA